MAIRILTVVAIVATLAVGTVLPGCAAFGKKETIQPAPASAASTGTTTQDPLTVLGLSDAEKAAFGLMSPAAKDTFLQARLSAAPASGTTGPAASGASASGSTASGTASGSAAPTVAPKKEVELAADGSVEITLSKVPVGITPNLLLDGNGAGTTSTRFTPVLGRDYQVNARWFSGGRETWCIEGPTCQLNGEVRVGGQLLDSSFTRKNNPDPNAGGGDFYFRILEAGTKDVTRTDPDPADATRTVSTTVQVKVYEIQPVPAPSATTASTTR